MFKYYLGLLISLLFFNKTLAKNINIQENINLTFKCELEKKIIKNTEYNYKVFLAKDLDKKDLNKFEIKSQQPETLDVDGLSLFLSKSVKLSLANILSELNTKSEPGNKATPVSLNIFSHISDEVLNLLFKNSGIK